MAQIDILKSLIEIHTVGDKENEKIIKYLESFLKKLSFQTKTVGEGPFCLVAYTKENPALGFLCHTDTVPDSSEWIRNPFTLTVEDDFLYGLGSSDMKGGIAALLEALTHLPLSDKKGLALYFTFDEEIGFKGIQMLTKEKIRFPKKLILPEPTNLVPVIASKGCMEFRVTVKGISAHSSTPHLGDNAIDNAFELIKEIENFYEILKKEENKVFSVPYATYNLSTICGGDSINKVPDTCTFTFDFRTISSLQNKKIKEKMREIEEKEIKVEVLNEVSPAINEDKEMIEWIEKETKKKKEGFDYTTEASFIEGCDLVIVGPGPVTAHQKDEHISRKSYEQTVALYQKLLEKYL